MPHWAFAGLLVSATALGGCAASDQRYPSFSAPVTSDEPGRVSVSFPGVSFKDPANISVASDPVPADIPSRLTAIKARADEASQAFDAQLPVTDTLTRAAQFAPVETDQWGDAQISLAELNSHHSEAQMALAELDLMAANATIALAGEETLSMITALQNNLSAQIDDQADKLEQVNANLEP